MHEAVAKGGWVEAAPGTAPDGIAPDGTAPDETAVEGDDFRALFEAAPGAYLVLRADAPRFTIVAASDAYLAATLLTREDALGRGVFEVLTDGNPANADASGVANLRASLAAVLRTGAPHRMAVQRYDLRRPDGTWEERYWAPHNVPVPASGGAPPGGATRAARYAVRYILHHVEDVTDAVRGREALARSERGAAAVLDRIPDAYIVLDRDFCFVDVNPAAERSMRKTRAELLGRSHWEVFPASVDIVAGRNYRRVARERVALHFTEHYRYEGYDVHLEMDAYPTDEGGVAVFWRDVTARVQGEAALRASEARYCAVFDATEQAFHRCEVLTDADGRAVDYRILDVNPAWARMTGLDPVASVGRTARDLIPDQSEGWIQTCGRAGLQREAVRVEQEVPALGRWYDVHLVPFGDPDSRQFLATAADITARKRADADRERLLAVAEAERERATEANASKSQFLATMSHELRTPLNAIGGYAQLLELGLHGPVSAAQQAVLGRVQLAQRRLLALINDVLNYAKLEGGRVEYRLDVVDVGAVIAEVAPLVEPQAAAKGLALAVRLPGGPCLVWADRDKLGQVLVNLLSNATKFTDARHPTTGAPGQVTVDVETRVGGGPEGGPDGGTDAGRPDAVFLRVRDTGRGIPREKQDAIFDPFVQVQTGYTRSDEGTGLGLAISRDLARGMGGDLRVRSAPGEGATFTVTLRRADVPPSAPAAITAAKTGEVAPTPVRNGPS